MKITLKGENFTGEYIAEQFYFNYMPQKIFIEIDSERDAVIKYNPSNAVPSRVWHGLAVRVYLPSYVYSIDEADNILKCLKKDISDIKDSYEEKYRDGRYWGSFDCSLIKALQEKVVNFTSELEIDK